MNFVMKWEVPIIMSYRTRGSCEHLPLSSVTMFHFLPLCFYLYIVLLILAGSDVKSFTCDRNRLASCYKDNGLTYDEQRPTLEIAGLGMWKDLCENPDTLTKVITCSLQYKRECDESTIHVDVEQGGNYASIICGDLLKHWDYKCAYASLVNVTMCPSSGESPWNATVEVHCRAFDASARCAELIFKRCGCASVKLITDILRGPGYPKKCGKSSFQEIQCHPDNALKFFNKAVNIEWHLFLFVTVIICIYLQIPYEDVVLVKSGGRIL